MDRNPSPTTGGTVLKESTVGNMVWGRGDRGTAGNVSTGIS